MELTDGSETSSDVEDLTESYPLEDEFFAPEGNCTPQKFLSKLQLKSHFLGLDLEYCVLQMNII